MCNDNECCCSSEENKKEKTENCCSSEEKKEECCDKETPSAGEILKELKQKETQEEESEARKYQNPAEEQGIEEDDETKDSTDIKEEMDLGERDEDLDTEEGRKKQVEDDEINPEEAGFMQGESGAGQLGKDALTGEPLMDVEDVVEAVIDGTNYRFINEENAEEFRKKREKEDL